jgi:hypothetical protein
LPTAASTTDQTLNIAQTAAYHRADKAIQNIVDLLAAVT